MLKVGVELYFKFEGLNPTGSFKDRGMTMAISKAAESGKEPLYVHQLAIPQLRLLLTLQELV
jgi:L-threonine synthase (EC 4.2.3.1)